MTNCQAKAFENTLVVVDTYITYTICSQLFAESGVFRMCYLGTNTLYFFAHLAVLLQRAETAQSITTFYVDLYVVMLLYYNIYAVLWHLCANIKKPKSNINYCILCNSI